MNGKKILAIEEYLTLCELLDDDIDMVADFLSKHTHKYSRRQIKAFINSSKYDRILDEIQFVLNLKYDVFIFYKIFK